MGLCKNEPNVSHCKAHIHLAEQKFVSVLQEWLSFMTCNMAFTINIVPSAILDIVNTTGILRMWPEENTNAEFL